MSNKFKKHQWWIFTVAVATPLVAIAAGTVPHVFTSGTPIVASQVNADFKAVADRLDAVGSKVSSLDTLASRIASLEGKVDVVSTALGSTQASVSALIERVDLKVFKKTGLNGSVSCETYCAGPQWGQVGTCVGANIDGPYTSCSQNLGISNARVGTCWCSAP